MDFLSFLRSARDADFWEQRKSIYFTGSSYPLIWIKTIFSFLEQKNILPNPYQRVFLDATKKKIIEATLKQSILGKFSFFGLGNLDEISNKKSGRELIRFFIAYPGPHTIVFFMGSDSKFAPNKKSDAIYLPENIDSKTFEELINFFGVIIDSKKTKFVKSVFSCGVDVSLDVCCMLMNYLELISSKKLEDYASFFSNIVGTSSSLSLLSECFFSKDLQRFFTLWSQIEKDYPEVFWIAFWAEQLWKASHFMTFINKKDFVHAKRISFRLPYAFVKRIWKRSNYKELVRAAQFLYHVDYALKTGSTFCMLDLFYLNYFSGKFIQGSS